MATNSNVFSQGGGGTTYEIETQTSFFINFLLGLNIPAVQGRISFFRQQSGSLGYKTDDLLLKCGHDSETVTVLCQMKHNLTISTKGEIFRQVVSDAWEDFRNPQLFDPIKDKIFIIKSDLTLDEKNHLNVMLDWSRSKADASDFLNEVSRIKAKRNYLDMLRSIIGDLFPDVLNDELLHKFCRTLYFLEYDFAQDNSKDRANCHSLLNQFKQDLIVTADELWKQLFALMADGNSKGASYHDRELPSAVPVALSRSNPSVMLNTLKRWSEQNYEIMEMTEDRIGDFALPRKELLQTLVETTNSSKIVVLAGNQGLGKSAVVKAYLTNIHRQNQGLVCCFKADELSDGNLRDYFLKHGINYNICEIFSLFGAFENNIVYIDALEKLLESTGLAFGQLLIALDKMSNVKVVISCRQVNLPLLDMKYLNKFGYTKFDIPELTDKELDLISENVPLLSKLFENDRLKSLLRIPKYLDFAYKAIRLNGKIDENVDEDGFIQFLWQTIIENKLNEFHDGLPARRSKTFIEVAVKRSKQMKPFVSLEQPDVLALEKLEKENILVQSTNKGFYAPAHDVLEDWALVNHVEFLFNNCSGAERFFDALGFEPAIRRAYRLWVTAVLRSDNIHKLKFITQQALSNSAEKFRSDECLIAIFMSQYCSSFFQANKESISANNYEILLRFLKILRTACKINMGDQHSKKYMPIGYGWINVISVIYENLVPLTAKHFALIYQFLKEWSNLLNYENVEIEVLRQAGLITLHLIKHHLKLDYRRRSGGDQEVKLLMMFYGGIQNELSSIIDECERDDQADEHGFYDEDRLKVKLIKAILSGSFSREMVKHNPNQVIELARAHWMVTSCKVLYPENERDLFIMNISRSSGSLSVNEHFGLRNEGSRFNYYPASALQSPTYWLLKYHPMLGAQFVTELSNWCAANYAVSEFADRDDLVCLDILLPDATGLKLYGSDLLWSVFRGSVKVSPYEWQSVLMACEKYLLELCADGSKNQTLLDDVIDYLLRNANSVAVLGLISSVYQAYPELAGKYLSVLYSNKELLNYDISRYVHDQTPFNIGTGHEEHDLERFNSDKLPHRLKYGGGLQAFIQDYCFNYGAANEEIFGVLDLHRQNVDPSDSLWRKKLDELDIRTWEITEKYDNGDTTGFIIQPKYDPEINEYAMALNGSKSESDAHFSKMNWLHQAVTGNLMPTKDEWTKIWKEYAKLDTFDSFAHRPGQLVEVGAKLLWEQLEPDEKEWCQVFAVQVVSESIDRSFNRSFDYGRRTPIIDLQSSIEGFCALLSKGNNPNQKDLEKLALCFLTAPHQENDPHAKEFYEAFSRNVWKHNNGLGSRILNELLRFSAFYESEFKFFFRAQSQAEKDAYYKKYVAFIDNAIDQEIAFDTNDIDLSGYSISYLKRAVNILPVETENLNVFEVIKMLIKLVANRLEDDRNYETGDRIRMLKLDVQNRASELILWNPHATGADFFEFVLEQARSLMRDVSDDEYERFYGIFKFFRGMLDKVIQFADNGFQDADLSKVEKLIDNFIKAWAVFHDYLVRNQVPMFSNVLLLDIEVGWKPRAESWKPIERNPAFFIGIIENFGKYNVQSVITLLSHIGDHKLFIDGFKWLSAHLRAIGGLNDLIHFQHIEQLISRGYYNHLEEIMGEELLLMDYLDMLDVLVKKGSPDAYWIREYMVTFSSK